jgi:hypothetical protein
MSYKRSDMVFKDYKWSAKQDYDDPTFIAHQEKAELDRMEGYEVLVFINHLRLHWNRKYPFTKSDCEAVERIIRDNVPKDIHSQKKIRDWIRSTYPNL